MSSYSNKSGLAQYNFRHGTVAGAQPGFQLFSSMRCLNRNQFGTIPLNLFRKFFNVSTRSERHNTEPPPERIDNAKRVASDRAGGTQD
jgi:hypothetical protein